MNWKKERSNKNYCGYCIGSPPSANCDGSCFTRKDYTYEQIANNRKDHIKTELEQLPLRRKQLDEREADLKKELEGLL